MITDAISFFEDDEIQKGIYFLGDEDNPNEIVISKKDKSYVKGNKLCFNYKGTDIYTDLDNVVYIDTKANIIGKVIQRIFTHLKENNSLIVLPYDLLFE
jgi:hypothetical protein